MSDLSDRRVRAVFIVAGVVVLLGLPALAIQAYVREGARAEASAALRAQQPPPAAIAQQVFVNDPPVRKVKRSSRSRRVSREGLPRAESQIGFAWPVGSAASITSPFGPRGKGDFHHGTDIGCSLGEAIRASAPGRVQFVGEARVYGNTVFIAHQHDYFTLYAHMSEWLVPLGQYVQTGQVIGLCGSTGRSTGPHLHLEIRQGRYVVDPMTLLQR
jgi:murein DD-endopeptidase MepM/ murein hydrolase activator NlpD